MYELSSDYFFARLKYFHPFISVPYQMARASQQQLPDQSCKVRTLSVFGVSSSPLAPSRRAWQTEFVVRRIQVKDEDYTLCLTRWEIHFTQVRGKVELTITSSRT